MCEKEVFMTAVQTLYSKDRCTDEHIHENDLSHSRGLFDLLISNLIFYFIMLMIL